MKKRILFMKDYNLTDWNYVDIMLHEIIIMQEDLW